MIFEPTPGLVEGLKGGLLWRRVERLRTTQGLTRVGEETGLNALLDLVGHTDVDSCAIRNQVEAAEKNRQGQ